MKTLNAIVFAIALCISAAGCAGAELAASVEGVSPPDRLTNEELLQLSDKELRLWLHGAFAGMGHGLIDAQNDQGRCIWEWYFGEEDRAPTIKAAMERYPEAGPSATIIAIAKRACPV